jgi:hypothetical protein
MTLPDSVSFRYYKSQAFRVIHSDGAFGGLTPRRDIFLAFYNERFPIPEVTVHRVDQDGSVAEEIRSERKAKTEIIREVDFGVVLDLEVAKSLLKWLTEKVGEAEKLEVDLAAKTEKREE